MKDLKKYQELLRTLPKEKYFDDFYGQEFDVYSLDTLRQLAELKYDNEKHYICMQDLQGAHYCEGCNFTAQDWCLKALDWCDSDTLTLTAQDLVLNCENEEEMIKYIAEIWQYEIVESTQERIMQLEKEGCEIINEYI